MSKPTRWKATFLRILLVVPIIYVLLSQSFNREIVADLGDWINNSGLQRAYSTQVAYALSIDEIDLANKWAEDWLERQLVLRQLCPECTESIDLIDKATDEMLGSLDNNLSKNQKIEKCFLCREIMNTAVGKAADVHRQLLVGYPQKISEILAVVFVCSLVFYLLIDEKCCT